MIRVRSFLVLILCSLIATPVFACLWDYDTLAMERRQFPALLELITGKFLRHSPAFYQWRIEDRQRKIENGSDDPQDYDDLAVALEKTGNTEQAIEIALKSNEKFPNRYETHANLGTFYIHDGQLEAGVEQIDKAIALNPDAHFGREIYQKLLVQYVLECQVDGETVLPLCSGKVGERYPEGFLSYLQENHFKTNDWKKIEQESDKAVKGIAGMMRFGNYDSPVLLEAMGDVLSRHWRSGPKRTATRAYLKASYEVDDPNAKKVYREKARLALQSQTVSAESSNPMKLEDLEVNFRKELKQAETWYSAVEKDETDWIQSNLNPETEFKEKYYQQPVLFEDSNAPSKPSRGIYWMIGVVVSLAGFIAAGLVFVRRRGKSNTSG